MKSSDNPPAPAHPSIRRAFGFPKRFRLCHREEIRRVQRRGKRQGTEWFTVVTLPNDVGHPRFGFAVSRKVGNAVVRNVVKRRLREVFRHIRPELEGVDVMVLARPSAASASLQELDVALRRVLLRRRR